MELLRVRSDMSWSAAQVSPHCNSFPTRLFQHKLAKKVGSLLDSEDTLESALKAAFLD